MNEQFVKFQEGGFWAHESIHQGRPEIGFPGRNPASTCFRSQLISFWFIGWISRGYGPWPATGFIPSGSPPACLLRPLTIQDLRMKLRVKRYNRRKVFIIEKTIYVNWRKRRILKFYLISASYRFWGSWHLICLIKQRGTEHELNYLINRTIRESE